MLVWFLSQTALKTSNNLESLRSQVRSNPAMAQQMNTRLKREDPNSQQQDQSNWRQG
jgi:hypothetical protein